MKNINNHMHLIGRLSANPEVKTMDNGTKTARFTMAVKSSYTNKNGKKTNVIQWYTVIALNKLATVAERFLHKGTHVTVEGYSHCRYYIDKEGHPRNTPEVVADELFVYLQQAA